MSKNPLLLAAFSVAMAATFFAHADIQSADNSVLDQTQGGACWDCRTQDFCWTTKPCAELKDKDGNGLGVWSKMVGTGIDQKFCADREALNVPGSGKKQCTTNTPKDCVKVYTCPNAQCTNCGQPGVEQKHTKCVLSGDACTVAD